MDSQLYVKLTDAGHLWSQNTEKNQNKTKPIKIHKSCCFAATIRTGEKNHQRGGLVKVVHCWSQSSHP
jgi:hypothetical protein